MRRFLLLVLVLPLAGCGKFVDHSDRSVGDCTWRNATIRVYVNVERKEHTDSIAAAKIMARVCEAAGREVPDAHH